MRSVLSFLSSFVVLVKEAASMVEGIGLVILYYCILTDYLTKRL